jgi:hypothetical protein
MLAFVSRIGLILSFKSLLFFAENSVFAIQDRTISSFSSLLAEINSILKPSPDQALKKAPREKNFFP